jgi:hypothetical protein
MKNQKKLTPEEFEALRDEVYKIMKENAKETREMKKETKEMRKENREMKRKMDEETRELKKQMKETAQGISRTEKAIAQTNKQIGGISRSNGEFCEEYFINSFKENPILFGEKFDRVMSNLYPDPMVMNDEYDLVLRNGTTTALIEMKYKADTDDVGKMFLKLKTYRANYPMFKDYKVYLCLASFRFPKKVREKADKEGIVLIQQRGEKIEIVSENIKAW